MATVRDIANELGISPGTVSKGLNGGQDISEDLRRKILDTAVRLGYTKRAAVSRNRKLCVFTENMEFEKEGDFGYDLALGFRQAAYRDHWNVDFIPVTPEEQSSHDYDAFMTEKEYSGACMLGFALQDPWMDSFARTAFPTVLLDNFIDSNPHVGYVGTDNEEAMELSIRHLISLGHEKIAFLDGSSGSLISDQRMLSYLSAMRRHHLPVDPNLAVYGYFVADAAQYHVPAFLQLGATAVLCGSDSIAEGVIDSCRQAGYSVPEDISVIGYDDLPFAAALQPPLSTIRQDRIALGKNAFFQLQAIMNGVPASINLLRPQLILRESTASARPRPVTERVTEKDSVMFIRPEIYAQAGRVM